MHPFFYSYILVIRIVFIRLGVIDLKTEYFKKRLSSLCVLVLILAILTGCASKTMGLSTFADIVQEKSYLVTDASGSAPGIKIWKVARLVEKNANIQYVEFEGDGQANKFYSNEVQNLKNLTGSNGSSNAGSFTLTDRNYYYQIMKKGKYVIYGTCPATYSSEMKDIMAKIGELEVK